MPHRPKPPTMIVAPSGMSATASSALASTLFMRRLYRQVDSAGDGGRAARRTAAPSPRDRRARRRQRARPARSARRAAAPDESALVGEDRRHMPAGSRPAAWCRAGRPPARPRPVAPRPPRRPRAISSARRQLRQVADGRHQRDRARPRRRSAPARAPSASTNRAARRRRASAGACPGREEPRPAVEQIRACAAPARRIVAPAIGWPPTKRIRPAAARGASHDRALGAADVGDAVPRAGQRGQPRIHAGIDVDRTGEHGQVAGRHRRCGVDQPVEGGATAAAPAATSMASTLGRRPGAPDAEAPCERADQPERRR